MKLIELKCQNCGSTMKVNAETKEVVCEYCGAKFVVDDEVQHIHYDNAEQAGYEFEKGRQKAQAEQKATYSFAASSSQQNNPVKKRRTWLWVLGWICIFPLPLTILIVRNKKLNKWVRIGIIAAAWIIYLAIGFAGGNSETEKTSSSNSGSPDTTIVQPQEPDDTDSSNSDNSVSIALDSFVEQFNSNSETKLVYVEDFDPQDKSSGHYRTAFRLGAYKDSVGRSFKYNDLTIDLITTKPLTGNPAIRLYSDGGSLDDCNAIIASSTLFFDSTFSESDIKEIT